MESVPKRDKFNEKRDVKFNEKVTFPLVRSPFVILPYTHTHQYSSELTFFVSFNTPPLSCMSTNKFHVNMFVDLCEKFIERLKRQRCCVNARPKYTHSVVCAHTVTVLYKDITSETFRFSYTPTYQFSVINNTTMTARRICNVYSQYLNVKKP
jgi:hypothetical protein